MGVGSLQTDSLGTPCPCTPWEASVASQLRQPPRRPEHMHHSVNTTVPAGPQHGAAGSGQPRVGWALGSASGLGPASRSRFPAQMKGAIEEDTEGEQCGRDPVTPCAPTLPQHLLCTQGKHMGLTRLVVVQVHYSRSLGAKCPKSPKTSPGLWHGPSLRHPFT